MSDTTTTLACPNCQTTIPVHEGFISWCHKCNWNVSVDRNDGPLTYLDSFYIAMSRKHSQFLFDSVVQAGTVRPTLTWPVVLAFILAGAVHLFTVLLLVAGILLVVEGWPYLLIVASGLLCLGVVWVIRPRVNDMPESILPREKFPALYELVDIVSDRLGTSRVDGIVIDENFNASFGRYGWRQKKILCLGLPLWSVLSNEEKIDLVGHEIAHDVNNDYNNSFIVGTATTTLRDLHYLLKPTEIWPRAAGLNGWAAVPFTLASYGLSIVMRVCAQGLEHLLWSSKQKAEYYADLLASSLAGKHSSLTGLEKILYEPIFQYEIRRLALQRKSDENLFANLKRAVEHLPRRETERLKRAGMYEVDRMNITHPPGFLRMNMIATLATEQASLVLPGELFQRIDREVQPFEEELQRRLVDSYRWRIS